MMGLGTMRTNRSRLIEMVQVYTKKRRVADYFSIGSEGVTSKENGLVYSCLLSKGC